MVKKLTIKKNHKNKNYTRKNLKYKKNNIRSKKGSSLKKYKLKGGAIYGNGYGANCYDPNFSIYNTRELQLFPYSPK